MTHNTLPLGRRANGRRRLIEKSRIRDDQYGDWFGQLTDSGLAVPEADDRVTRELDWAYLKLPGRGVPPPRSGPPPMLGASAMYKRCAVLDECPAGAAEHLPELSVCAYQNGGGARGTP
jgi:hypothetical protein